MYRLALILLVACGRSENREAAAKLFKEIEIDTAPGLSGLAVDTDGALWTVAEREDRAYRITLTGDTPKYEEVRVEGVPNTIDLEGIAWLGPDKFAFGTEGKQDGIATVLLAERRGQALVVTKTIELPAKTLGVELPANHGAEGICGTGDTIIAAIEGAGMSSGKRFAPIVRITNAEIARVHRMWLTTKTGKISGLDCTIAADGTADVIAIERHFEVTKIVKFTVPNTDGDITPTEALDLGPILKSRLNLEGIAKTPDGRTYAVVDNQWKTITGPSVFLRFEPAAMLGN